MGKYIKEHDQITVFEVHVMQLEMLNHDSDLFMIRKFKQYKMALDAKEVV